MTRVSTFLAAALAILAPNANIAASTSGAKVQTGYAPVNGLNLYYQIHGDATPSQPPLVLLHGGGDTIQTSFGALLPGLARDRQVIAFEQQGFGHTADIADRVFTFERSAGDTAALLDYLHIPQADLLGFSNGATIALEVAIRHPKLVRKLVLISGLYSRAGAPPQFWAGFQNAKLSDMPQELRDTYATTSPHPEKLQSFFDKCVARMRNFQDIPEDSVRRITSPALIVLGDRDVVLPEHAIALSRLLPQSQLAILPNTDHMHVTKRTAWLTPAINNFLNLSDKHE